MLQQGSKVEGAGSNGSDSGCRRVSISAHRRVWNRRWIGFTAISASCGLAWLAFTVSPWFWLASALLVWCGGYQVVSAAGCGAGTDTATDAAMPKLAPKQRQMRYRSALCFMGFSILVGSVSALWFPLLWPLSVLAGWFAASFFVAGMTGYIGCPEIGAIPSWVLGRPIASQCPPLDRHDRSVGGGA